MVDIKIEYNNSKKLFIFFGGLPNIPGYIPFEFVKTTRRLDADKIFVRDLDECWYNKEIEKLRLVLKTLINKKRYKKIFCVGSSSGGYAAILFGIWFGVNFIHAFSPQTFLDFEKMKNNKDKKEIIEKAEENKDIIKFENIRQYLNKYNNSKSKIFLHYCKNYKPDETHVNELKDFPNVLIFRYDCDYHSSSTFLKKKKLLRGVIQIE